MHPRTVYKLLCMVDPGPVNLHHIVNAFSHSKQTDDGLLQSIDILIDGHFIEVDDDDKISITEIGKGLRKSIQHEMNK